MPKMTWRAPEDEPQSFAISRFLFFLTLLILIEPARFFQFLYLPDALWLPTGIFTNLNEPLRFSALTVGVLSWSWRILATLCMFDVFFRASSILFFILNLVMMNVIYNYGFFPHAFPPIVLATFAMALGGQHRTFLIRFIFCAVFFAAGLSKLRNSGLEWFTSESIQNILLRSEIYFSDVDSFARKVHLEMLLAPHLVLAQIFACGSLALELIAPLALFSRRLRPAIVLGIALMQASIYFLIFVNFKWYACLYLFWIDWRKVTRRLKIDNASPTVRYVMKTMLPVFLLTPLLAALVFLTKPFSAATILISFVVSYFAIYLVSANLYHRYWSHRQFEMQPMFERVTSLLGIFVMTGDPISYARMHRWHHAHADTSLDFHSPIHGRFNSFIGWMFKPSPVPNSMIPDLLKHDYLYLQFLSKYKIRILWLTLFALSALSLNILLGFMLAMCVACFFELLTNAIAHSASKRQARNAKILAWFTLSTYHHDHHAEPTMIRDNDPGRLLLKTLAMLKLIKLYR